MLTVSQLNRYIKSIFDENRKMHDVFVVGEITNYAKQGGHCYFALKDSTSLIKTVLFNSHAMRVNFNLQNGMSVIVRGNVSSFERDGVYQLYAMEVAPYGSGTLHIAFEQLKEKLSQKGYFEIEHKKSLPAIPEKIGVITSSKGAVIHDIINVLNRRYPAVTVVFSDVSVQGVTAVESMIKALYALDKKCDVIIIGRGGGSLEDLAAFNDEKLADVLYEMDTPIVSAVGHESDYTICDFVADVRAATPSVAAEIVSPNKTDLQYQLLNYTETLHNRIAEKINIYTLHLKLFEQKTQSAKYFIVKRQEKLESYKNSLQTQYGLHLQNAKNKLSLQALKLQAMSPLNVLSRGYTMNFKDTMLIKSVKEINEGDLLLTKFNDGEIYSKVIEKRG